MLRKLIVAAILAIAVLMPGCDVMDQDVQVYPPGSAPGEEDEEDTAQTLVQEDD